MPTDSQLGNNKFIEYTSLCINIKQIKAQTASSQYKGLIEKGMFPRIFKVNYSKLIFIFVIPLH